MLLQPVIANLTRYLDVVSQKCEKGISSGEKSKEETISCLISIIQGAPEVEFTNLVSSQDHEILLGYLLNILCRIAKDEKSKHLKLLGLRAIESLINRLRSNHEHSRSIKDQCSIMTLVLALPGLSSALFKLFMSDTKLPKTLLIQTLKTLNSCIVAALSCREHETKKTIAGGIVASLNDKDLNDTCDNLAVRIHYLLDYVIKNDEDLNVLIKMEVLNLCHSIVNDTRPELVTKCMNKIVRFIAFSRSCFDHSQENPNEAEVKILYLMNSISAKMDSCDGHSNRLDMTAIEYMSRLLEDLEENCLKMLISDRQANLGILCGILHMLPEDVLSTYLEDSVNRDRIFNVFIILTEFSPNQPFLFLTDSHIGSDALEVRDERIYTSQKKFAHSTFREQGLIDSCCRTIGRKSEWSILCDILTGDTNLFISGNNLYIIHQILIGCLEREQLQHRLAAKLASQLIECYADQIRRFCYEINRRDDELDWSAKVIKSIIGIETLVTLIEIYLNSNQDPRRKITILRNLLCPLLSWCSSASRAVSEVSLNSLTQIGLAYGHQSTKSFIEAYIDYIVDDASKMLHNFTANPEVTDVLAMCFKLSTLDTFHIFSDVFERVFNVLAKYHHTEQSKFVVLLFFRTLQTLCAWLDIGVDPLDTQTPLSTKVGVDKVLESLNIHKRISKLSDDIEKARHVSDNINRMRIEIEQTDPLEDIASPKSDLVDANDETELDSNPKKEKSFELILTERIVRHCLSLVASSHPETRVLALKTASYGFKILSKDEDVLLPLVHQIWPSLMYRLSDDHNKNLEVSVCAFDCLVTIAIYSGDFIKRRALENIVPKLCLFLESQATQSIGKRDYDPYCMTLEYKCQTKILKDIGAIAFHTQIAYDSLWRIVEAVLKYQDQNQPHSLRVAARNSLSNLIALDADCVWYFAMKKEVIREIPLDRVLEL